MFFRTVETALMHWNILSHKSYCMTCSFQKSLLSATWALLIHCLYPCAAKIAVTCDVLNLSSASCLCWQELLPTLDRRSLRWGLEISWSGQILPSPQKIHTREQEGRKEEQTRETNLLINSQTREAQAHKILINQVTSYLHVLLQIR